MLNKAIDEDYKFVNIIDDLILQLSLIKNGQKPTAKFYSDSNLLKKMIEGSIYLKEMPLSKKPVSHIKSYESNKNKVFKEKNENAEEIKYVKKFLGSLKNKTFIFNEDDINKFQEKLLQISLPIWEKEVVKLTKANLK